MDRIIYTENKFELKVNNINFYELSYFEQKNIVNKLINKCPEDGLYKIITMLCKDFGFNKNQNYEINI